MGTYETGCGLQVSELKESHEMTRMSECGSSLVLPSVPLSLLVGLKVPNS